MGAVCLRTSADASVCGASALIVAANWDDLASGGCVYARAWVAGIGP